jgi:hypothetical protein
MSNSILSLTSELNWGGWSTPRPGRFTAPPPPPGKDRIFIVQETGWDPRGRSVQVRKTSPPPPHRDSIPGPSSSYPVAVPTEISRTTRNLMSISAFTTADPMQSVAKFHTDMWRMFSPSLDLRLQDRLLSAITDYSCSVFRIHHFSSVHYFGTCHFTVSAGRKTPEVPACVSLPEFICYTKSMEKWHNSSVDTRHAQP